MGRLVGAGPTGASPFWGASAFFLRRRSRSSLMRLSMSATSRLRLFSRSLCCCSRLLCSWLSLLRICEAPGKGGVRGQAASLKSAYTHCRHKA